MSFESQDNIIDIINQKMHALGFLVQSIEVPRDLPEYQVLKGKNIVIVDDVPAIIERLLPTLLVATGGKAEAIIQGDLIIGGIARNILAAKPDFVLMDRNLSGAKGSDVIRVVLRRNPNIKFIGFSSENYDDEFTAAGAICSIHKESYDPEGTVIDLAKKIK